MKVILVHEERCLGCKCCEIACSSAREGIFNPQLARCENIELEKPPYFYTVLCLQCPAPSCAAVCPTGAIQRDPETGLVHLDQRSCSGCRLCLPACPFGAMFFAQQRGAAVKCEHCGGEPQCVAFCPTGCLEYVEQESREHDFRVRTLLGKGSGKGEQASLGQRGGGPG